jgi:hypothetical protein
MNLDNIEDDYWENPIASSTWISVKDNINLRYWDYATSVSKSVVLSVRLSCYELIQVTVEEQV